MVIHLYGKLMCGAHSTIQKMVEKVPLRKAISRLDFPAVAAFGNPLLDIFVILKNDELFKKYNLESDGERELCEKKMQELIADLPQLINMFVMCLLEYISMCLHCILIFFNQF